MSTVLQQLSDALQAQAQSAQSVVAAIVNADGRHLSGILWHDDIVITSEQAMAARSSYSIVASGTSTTASIVGRDPGTNLLALRTEQSLRAARPVAAQPAVGALVLAHGATALGTPTARLGIVNDLGPPWHSRDGGRIDARIALDIRLRRTEEGGPVLSMRGELLGMSTFGVAGEVLVIPSATIERVLPQLLQTGRIARGWLGLALQPIAIPEALRADAAQTRGMIVMSIEPDAPGAKGGVIAGDILLALNGVPMCQPRQLAAQLDSESIGKSAALSVIRGGKSLTLTLEISARPTR